MADVLANIKIVTSGGDESAAEVSKATTALNNMTSASSGMESQFQHRFQHIGLMLFAGDALRASGLGAETRQVIGGLNTALIAGESAFGAAAGPAFLFVAALTAVAGIAVKVIEHHKNIAESLDKVVKSQQDALAATQDDIAVLTRYNEVVGGAGGLLDSEQKLANIQKGELLDSERQQVKAIEDLMQSNILHAKIMSLVEDAYALFKNTLIQVGSELLHFIPGIGVLADAYDILKNKIEQATTSLKSHGFQYQINADESKKLTDENAKLQVKMDQLIFSINHGGTAWKDYAKNANDAFAQVEADMLKTQQEYDKDMAKIDSETQKVLSDMTKEWNKHAEEVSNKIGDKIGGNFAKMTNDMLFHQKTLKEALNSLWQNMAEEFISYVEKMIAKWLVLQAVMAMGGGGAFAGIMGTGGGGSDFPAFATGGSMFADRPTLAMFGEAGPEMATFSPISGGGPSSDGSGGNTQVNNITVNVQGVVDQNMVQQIGQKIVTMIRGQGQLDFVRA